MPHAIALQTEEALDLLRQDSLAGRNDAAWLRETYQELGSMNDVARRQSERWIERAKAPVHA